MASKTEICNLALSHLAQSKEIANVDTERSDEAAAFRRFYEIARKTSLKRSNHSFTNVTSALALVEEQPNDEWAYSYRYPTDCLKPIRILSGIRNDNRQSRVAYKIGKDSSGRLIYTDQADAEIEYIQDVSDTSRYPDDFVLELSFLLAGLAAPRILGEDPYGLGKKSMEKYLYFRGISDSDDFNSQQAEEEPQAEWIRERG